MCEKTENKRMAFRKVCSIFMVSGVVCSTAYLIYVHRRVIKSAFTGEPMPECPHKHHCHDRKEK